jgi:hypothetical protein
MVFCADLTENFSHPRLFYLGQVCFYHRTG